MGQLKAKRERVIYNFTKYINRSIKPMNDQLLTRNINSIGRSCFIKHFELLTNQELSTKQITEKLIELEGYSENGARTRVNCTKRILKLNCIERALDMVIDTKKISNDIKLKAEQIKIHYL